VKTIKKPAAAVEKQIVCVRHPALAVRVVPGKGRGVFATAFIPEGALLEESPVAILTPEESDFLDNTPLGGYTFEWRDPAYEGDAPSEEANRLGTFVFGLISLFNHSYSPNAKLERNYDARTMKMRAVRDIAAGEELTFDYGGELWFDPLEDAATSADDASPASAPVFYVRHPALAVRVVPGKGRGVFATAFIPEGTLTEESPLLIGTPKESRRLPETQIGAYCFAWQDPALADSRQENDAPKAIMLGLASLFSHSSNPNVEIKRDYRAGTIRAVTLRDVEPGEELAFRYGALWFDAAEGDKSA
jgi:SET domain-containing protein